MVLSYAAVNSFGFAAGLILNPLPCIDRRSGESVRLQVNGTAPAHAPKHDNDPVSLGSVYDIFVYILAIFMLLGIAAIAKRMADKQGFLAPEPESTQDQESQVLIPRLPLPGVQTAQNHMVFHIGLPSLTAIVKALGSGLALSRVFLDKISNCSQYIYLPFLVSSTLLSSFLPFLLQMDVAAEAIEGDLPGFYVFVHRLGSELHPYTKAVLGNWPLMVFYLQLATDLIAALPDDNEALKVFLYVINAVGWLIAGSDLTQAYTGLSRKISDKVGAPEVQERSCLYSIEDLERRSCYQPGSIRKQFMDISAGIWLTVVGIIGLGRSVELAIRPSNSGKWAMFSMLALMGLGVVALNIIFNCYSGRVRRQLSPRPEEDLSSSNANLASESRETDLVGSTRLSPIDSDGTESSVGSPVGSPNSMLALVGVASLHPEATLAQPGQHPDR